MFEEKPLIYQLYSLFLNQWCSLYLLNTWVRLKMKTPDVRNYSNYTNHNTVQTTKTTKTYKPGNDLSHTLLHCSGIGLQCSATASATVLNLWSSVLCRVCFGMLWNFNWLYCMLPQSYCLPQFTVEYAVCNWAFYSIQCTVCSVQYTVCSVQCAVYSL